ncbi:MAG TPA: hypothetical protein VGF39_05860 [Stellaceae bacterium]|jgi:hypothetical protein
MYATAPAGSLRLLRNAFVTAGAEIEKRAAFTTWRTATAGSIGLMSRDGVTYVVVNGASAITAPTASAPGIIALPYGETIVRVADWDLFNGQFYIVLQGVTRYWHYYNQVYVSDALATASSVRTFGTKVYGVDGRILRYSAINNPALWTPDPVPANNAGQGYVDLSAQDADSTVLVGLEVFNNQLAIFSKLSTQFWSVNADPAQNQFRGLLRSTGLLGANALHSFGNGDVMYLSAYGIRSLRVQNLSLTAGTTDVGTPVDALIQQLMVANGPGWFAGARCLVQPRSGRLFMMLPDRILVLSTFQEPAITAWAQFDAAFQFNETCVSDPYVMMRGSDGVIYQYGGDQLLTYDSTQAEVVTPALSFENPSKMKIYQAFDVGAEGTWTLSAGCDVNNQATEEVVATFTGSTFMDQTMTMPEMATHISLRFRTTDASQAKLGYVTVMYQDGSTD